MRHAALLLAVFAVSPVLADEARTFGGELGGRSIVMELTDGTGGPVVGRLAYMETGGDIPLLPVSHEGNSMVLHEEAPCDESTCKIDEAGNAIDPPLAAEWRLTYDPDTYIATGTRTSLGRKGKSVAVELYAIAWRTLDADETISTPALHERSARMGYDQTVALDWSLSPYEMTLLDVPLEASAPQALGLARVHYLTDPRTKFAFPRVMSLGDGTPYETTEAINALLEDRHGRMSLAAFDCLAFQYASYGRNEYLAWAGGTLGDYDEESVVITYASSKLVSWTQSGSLWCGGAHPYNHFDSYTLDVATGKPLDLAKVFAAWVPRQWGAALDQVAGAKAVRANPDDYYWGPSLELIAYLRSVLPQDLFDAELEEVCFADEAIAEHLDIRFATDAQVTFTLSGFPHVSSVCNGDLATVALRDLGPFLAPGATAYFPER